MYFRFLLGLAAGLVLSAADPRAIAVISHRGEHLQHVENTLPAFEAAWKAGASYFECDVRTTSDGKFVLMHDGKVDRTTNGHGEVSKLTFDEIRALKPAVPTFDEALAFAKGKIGVYIDAKEVPAREIVEAVDRYGMRQRVVVYGGPELLQAVQALAADIRVMPEAQSLENSQKLMASLRLKVMAFDYRDFKVETVSAARSAGIDVYVDRLGPQDNPRVMAGGHRPGRHRYPDGPPGRTGGISEGARISGQSPLGGNSRRSEDSHGAAPGASVCSWMSTTVSPAEKVNRRWRVMSRPRSFHRECSTNVSPSHSCEPRCSMALPSGRDSANPPPPPTDIIPPWCFWAGMRRKVSSGMGLLTVTSRRFTE